MFFKVLIIKLRLIKQTVEKQNTATPKAKQSGRFPKESPNLSFFYLPVVYFNISFASANSLSLAIKASANIHYR